MIQIKKLKRPSKRSGIALKALHSTELKKFGVIIWNTSKETLYIDSVKTKRK